MRPSPPFARRSSLRAPTLTEATQQISCTRWHYLAHIRRVLSLQKNIDAADRVHAEPLRKFIEPHGNDRSPERRLFASATVSPDFKQHAVAPMVLPLCCMPTTGENFQVFCYGAGSTSRTG